MRVIVVEDEEKLARAMVKGLEKQGFAVDTVANGSEAAEQIIIHHNVYDVIILDLMLPGRSGLDICRALRERGISTPILILTAKSSTTDKIMLLNTGADDYLTKPFSFEELVARIKALMRRPDKALPSELVVGVLRLDTSLHRLYVNETVVPLTTKEFALMEYFMRHPDEVIDREQILDHVWDFNFNSLSNVVDVHIKNLRRKLAQEDNRTFIETVEGVGYRLVLQT